MNSTPPTPDLATAEVFPFWALCEASRIDVLYPEALAEAKTEDLPVAPNAIAIMEPGWFILNCGNGDIDEIPYAKSPEEAIEEWQKYICPHKAEVFIFRRGAVPTLDYQALKFDCAHTGATIARKK